MSLIQVKNLSFSYPGSFDRIFENVSFQIDTDWKLGFIGRNGKGKTTFLNLLLGKYEYTGEIIANTTFDYFPYQIKSVDSYTGDIMQKICPSAAIWEIQREISCLDAEQDILYRPFKTLSAGEQTKVLLAAMFLNEERFLLIDEPTNHLDAEARKAVAAYLKRKKGFILVSHDRAFLDDCVDHILAVNKTDIEVQNGNFSSWYYNFQNRQNFEQTQYDRLTAEIKKQKAAARRTTVWSDRVEKTKSTRLSGIKPDKGYIGHKSAKAMKRAKTYEARQNKNIEEKSRLLQNAERGEKLKISPLSHYESCLAEISEIIVKYDGAAVCGPVSFTIRQGERLALTGKNGCGKSSILKLLLNQNLEYTGSIRLASGLKISYVPQDTSNLSGSLAEYAEQQHIDITLFQTILRKMGFSRHQFLKDIKDFSGGQKKKVLIAKSLSEKAHLYIWDEPLNYIDIYSRLQIEELIKDFSPSMIFVEHDREFRENTATEAIEIKRIKA